MKEVVMAKPAWASKLNILGIAQVFLGAADVAAGRGYFGEYGAIVVMVTGVVTMVIRTFYTERPVTMSLRPEAVVVEWEDPHRDDVPLDPLEEDFGDYRISRFPPPPDIPGGSGMPDRPDNPGERRAR